MCDAGKSLFQNFCLFVGVFQNGVAGRLRRASCVTNHRATRLRPEMQDIQKHAIIFMNFYFFMFLYDSGHYPLFYLLGRQVTVNGLSPALEAAGHNAIMRKFTDYLDGGPLIFLQNFGNYRCIRQCATSDARQLQNVYITRHRVYRNLFSNHGPLV